MQQHLFSKLVLPFFIKIKTQPKADCKIDATMKMEKLIYLEFKVQILMCLELWLTYLESASSLAIVNKTFQFLVKIESKPNLPVFERSVIEFGKFLLSYI